MGVEILTPGASTSPATPPEAAPRSTDSSGLKAVGPVNATPLPAIEKPTAAPDAINDIAPGSQPAAQKAAAKGKQPKPAFDKGEESSSKHKKKKGLAKINPF